MTNRMTAKALRKMTPPQDLNDKAFQPERIPSRPQGHLANTLKGLKERLGEYGEAAVLCAEWDAIFAWLRQDDPTGLPADVKVVREALTLWREEVLFSVGLSRRSGLHLPILRRISEPSQQEAEKIAADAVKHWIAAGCPRLTGNSIRWSHQMFLYRLSLKKSEERRAAMETVH